jgi:hypothetical protein
LTRPPFRLPLYNPQYLNRYSYCLNNPLKYIDPTGHSKDDLDAPTKDGQLGWSEGQWYISTGLEWCPAVDGTIDALCELYQDSDFSTWDEFMECMNPSEIYTETTAWDFSFGRPKNGYTSRHGVYWSLIKMRYGHPGNISLSGMWDGHEQAENTRKAAAVFDSIGEGITQSVPQDVLFAGLALGGIVDLPGTIIVLSIYAGCAKAGDALRGLADWEDEFWDDRK